VANFQRALPFRQALGALVLCLNLFVQEEKFAIEHLLPLLNAAFDSLDILPPTGFLALPLLLGAKRLLLASEDFGFTEGFGVLLGGRADTCSFIIRRRASASETARFCGSTTEEADDAR